MSQQSLFTTVNLNAATAVPIIVKTGFVPGKIELVNLTKLQAGAAATVGYKSFWQYGMPSATAVSTVWGASATFYDTTAYVATQGITILNPLGSEHSQYGAVVSGFTNASPGVITVDSTSNAQITAGCFIQVSLVANTFAGATLNGIYYVASVTATTITLGTAPAGVYQGQGTVKSPNTSALGVYVSGGVVTLLQTAQATTPNPPFNIYSNDPTWYNAAVQGFVIGTNVFAGATYAAGAGDVILVAAWDMMQP